MFSKNYTHKRGQILILFATSLVVLIGFVGLAIDSDRSFGVKAKLSSAVDAAAIAGASALAKGGATDALREAAAIKAATDFYIANFPTDYYGATLAPLGVGDVTAVHDLQDGFWTVTVNGSATMPVGLMRLLGFTDVTVSAQGETIRRDLDIILVLDTSGSLASPSTAFPLLQAAAVKFVNRFIDGPNGDRVGFIRFASGVATKGAPGYAVDVPILKTGARGFVKTDVVNAINALKTPTGSTAAAEGMRRALNEINGVPTASRSSLRMIVIFSDGAPNDVPAEFCYGPIKSGICCNGSVTKGVCKTPRLDNSIPLVPLLKGDLYSETSGPGTNKATNIYDYVQRDTLLGSYTKTSTLPSKGFPLTNEGIDVPNSEIPLASYNNKRSLTLVSPVNGTSFPYTNTRCNVNKAARNMVENVANTARGQKIKIYSIALGAAVNSQEITFCGYGANDSGSSILKRLANDAQSDTYDPTQPSGLYVWASNASDLDDAFSKVGSDILRLTR
jgi:Flp pilus assembly protein TadG